MDLDKVGKFIAKNRNLQNLTQKELAELLDVNPKTVSKWERGVNAPDIAVLSDLAKHLNITIEELLAGHKINRHKSKLKKFIHNSILKKKKTPILAIITFIIFAIIFIAGKSIYKYKLENTKADIYRISTDNEDYEVNGYLVMNKDSFDVDITEIKKREVLDDKRDYKASILEIEFVNDTNILYNYSIKEENGLYLFDILENHDIQFNSTKKEELEQILRHNNKIIIKYCREKSNCNTIQLILNLKKS